MSIFSDISTQQKIIDDWVDPSEFKQKIVDWIAVNSGQYTEQEWEQDKKYQQEAERALIMTHDTESPYLPTYIWMAHLRNNKSIVIQRLWVVLDCTSGLYPAKIFGDVHFVDSHLTELPEFIVTHRVFLHNSDSLIPWLEEHGIKYETD